MDHKDYAQGMKYKPWTQAAAYMPVDRTPKQVSVTQAKSGPLADRARGCEWGYQLTAEQSDVNPNSWKKGY